MNSPITYQDSEKSEIEEAVDMKLTKFQFFLRINMQLYTTERIKNLRNDNSGNNRCNTIENENDFI